MCDNKLNMNNDNKIFDNKSDDEINLDDVYFRRCFYDFDFKKTTHVLKNNSDDEYENIPQTTERLIIDGQCSGSLYKHKIPKHVIYLHINTIPYHADSKTLSNIPDHITHLTICDSGTTILSYNGCLPDSIKYMEILNISSCDRTFNIEFSMPKYLASLVISNCKLILKNNECRMLRHLEVSSGTINYLPHSLTTLKYYSRFDSLDCSILPENLKYFSFYPFPGDISSINLPQTLVYMHIKGGVLIHDNSNTKLKNLTNLKRLHIYYAKHTIISNLPVKLESLTVNKWCSDAISDIKYLMPSQLKNYAYGRNHCNEGNLPLVTFFQKYKDCSEPLLYANDKKSTNIIKPDKLIGITFSDCKTILTFPESMFYHFGLIMAQIKNNFNPMYVNISVNEFLVAYNEY